MLKRFDEALCNESWDAVFIGSGPGSLTAATLMAQAGHKVLVLERHYEPGGFSHTFKRKEWEWDVGVHYIGAVHHPRTLDRKAFDLLTGGRLEWEYMDSPYDRAIIDGKTYDFVPGEEAQIAQWIEYFPEEEEAIRKYWALVRETQRSSQMFFAEKAVPNFISNIAGGLMVRKFMRYASRTTYDVLKELTDNEDLITMLCTQCGDYGLPPNKSSFAIHAMVVNHYRDGGNYPVGGAPSINEGMIENIEELGGTVAVRSPVESIAMENGKAVGVQMESGAVVRAKHIISGAGVYNTFKRFLPADVKLPFDIDADLARVKPSVAHVCCYVGLEGSDEELKLPKYNYWCYDPYVGDNTPGGRITTAYISFPSAKDPAWAEKHPGKSTVQIIALGPYDDVEQWKDTKWARRGDDYDAYKQGIQDEMLERLYELHPETRGRVGWAELSTPLSTVHFSNYPKGEIYGLEHTPERFKLKWLRPRTPIPNLYLTGQDICTAGIVGAMFSGILTASVLLNKNMINVIKGA